MKMKPSSFSPQVYKVISDERFVAAQNRPQFFNSNLRQEAGNKLQIDARFLKMYDEERFGMSVKGKKYSKRVNEKNNSAIRDKNIVTKRRKEKLKNAPKSHLSLEGSLDSFVVPDNINKHIKVEDCCKRKLNRPKSNFFTQYKDEKSHIDYLTSLSRGEIEIITSSDENYDIADRIISNEVASDKVLSKKLVCDNLNKEMNTSIKINTFKPSVTGFLSMIEENKNVTYKPTPFLALCNMDWTHVRAVDIFVIFSSFSPPGTVNQVVIYPSNFGIEKMLKEETLGQLGIWKDEGLDEKNIGIKTKKDNSLSKNISDNIIINSCKDHPSLNKEEHQSPVNNSENDNLTGVEKSTSTEVLMAEYDRISFCDNSVEPDYDPEKLREYERSKLKYYFALVEFTSNTAANAAFSELDGIEVGHSSALMDLSYVQSEDMNNITRGREIKDRASSIPMNYKPTDFVIKALQQTDIECTWETGDTERQRMLTQYRLGKKEWDALAERNDLSVYLACDSDTTSSCDSRNYTLRNKRNVKNIMKRTQIRKAFGLNKFSSSTETDIQDDNMNKKGKNVNIITHTLNKPNKDLEYMNLYDVKVNNYTQQDICDHLEQKNNEKKNGQRLFESIGKKRKDNNVTIELSHSKVMKQKENRLNEHEVHFVCKKSKLEYFGRRKGDKLSLDSLNDAKNNLSDNVSDIDYRLNKKKMKKIREFNNINDSKPNFEIDINDLRFAPIIEGNDDRFNIDTTNPNYKNTPAMKLFLSKRKARGAHNLSTDTTIYKNTHSLDNQNRLEDKNNDSLELGLLLRNIKNRIK